MRKKITAILPLYLAGLIMLAFAVFPHHHHHEYICFTTTHCVEQGEGETHHHDSSSEHEECVNQLFQTQITRGLSLTDCCQDGHCHHFITPLFLASAIFELLSLNAANDILPDTAFREKLHSILRTTDLSGRAPPFQI